MDLDQTRARRAPAEVSGLGNALWPVAMIASALPPFTAVRLRTALFRSAGVAIGRGSVMAGRVWIAGGTHWNLTVGDRRFVNDGVRFATSAPVCIGNDVDIAHAVKFITSTHDVGGDSRRAGTSQSGAVSVGNGSWIGAGAVILPGVTIGEGSVVGAGSVVNRSVPPNTIVGGSPAGSIRQMVPLDTVTGRRTGEANRAGDAAGRVAGAI